MSDRDNQQPPTVGFRPFWKTLKQLSVDPLKQPTFVFSLVGMVAFSGWAIWIELALWHYGRPQHDAASVHTAIVTFFPALVGTSFIQLVMDETGKPLRALSILILVASLSVAFLLAFDEGSFGRCHWLAIGVSVFAAVWLWVVANAETSTFQDDPDAPAGGDPMSELPGKTDGYEV